MTYNIEKKITNVDLASDGSRLEITTRYPSNLMIGTSQAPDRVFKDIYIIRDNKIILLDTIEGKVIPSKIIPEEVTFPGISIIGRS